MTTGTLDPTAAAGHHPSITPRLAVPGTARGPLALAEERALGTYTPPQVPDVVAALAEADLRGRGGGAFPAHVKWAAVAAGTGPRVVVANGEEGEPASAKDRWLLTHRPHLVLDGLLLAARTVGAERTVVYLSHPGTVQAIEQALDELRDAGGLPGDVRIDVHVVAHSYVAGEETAACRAIDGGPALPVAKPPRPFESGVGGAPTLVSNVETLAHAAWISRNGAAAYREVGTAASPGTTLVTLSGACARPGVYEVPFGLSVLDLFTSVGGGLTSEPSGYVMGGWFGGVLAPQRAAVGCCYDAVRMIGSGLGCAAITALGATEDPVVIAADIAAWYARETAAQCGVCVRGTASIRDALGRLRDGTSAGTEPDDLARWGAGLSRRGACAFLDGAATLARTVVAEFPVRVADRARSAHHHTPGDPS
ncbi:NADH-ubiquinone oxidoreductase-F iron-sulfur binding region domain-containing protein [Pseudonocardia petroleophila]|uniref:NADH dehydrogenase subunit F n=1 Tax=Pseudonocardia petroleophila TaxID=37331 RepID=A0A7G7MKJ3_9PSEU|nr:NADH-ubiquinone oxidoreductase-F iron-sulfur binding region domain-containing protein [Pseudonocardia petroleophila]QNG53304.1 NADH dehydrogenase subunit F [Pseudonocardia petroleophila]